MRASEPVLDFSININPLVDPERALTGIFQQFHQITSYPDPECRQLTACLARRHGVEASQVVVGNGSTDLTFALTCAWQPQRVAIVEPTYTEYLRAALLVRAEVTHWVPEGDDFRPEPFDPAGADLLWVCNPNNPTGYRWPAGRLAAWIAGHSETLFAVDEAFLPFHADEADHSLIPWLDRLYNVIVFRSLTKVYAIPGLRLGYAVTTPDLANEVRERWMPWRVNCMAQGAGLAILESLDEPALLTRTRAWLRRELPAFHQQLKECSSCLQPLPSQANFILVRLHEVGAGWLTGRLAERGIAIRNASNFVGLDDRYVRLAVRKRAENARLIEELQIVLREG